MCCPNRATTTRQQSDDLNTDQQQHQGTHTDVWWPHSRVTAVAVALFHLPFVQHLRLVQIDAASAAVCSMIGARYQTCGH